MTDEAMIDRVARAIAWRLCGRRGRNAPCPKPTATGFPEPCRCLTAARSAIEAMREPTGEMIDAGAASMDPFEPTWSGFPSKTWRAMIDTAGGRFVPDPMSPYVYPDHMLIGYFGEQAQLSSRTFHLLRDNRGGSINHFFEPKTCGDLRSLADKSILGCTGWGPVSLTELRRELARTDI